MACLIDQGASKYENVVQSETEEPDPILKYGLVPVLQREELDPDLKFVSSTVLLSGIYLISFSFVEELESEIGYPTILILNGYSAYR